MSDNKYALNLHFNSPNVTNLHNLNFTYKITDDTHLQNTPNAKYLLALYDKAFYGSYVAGANTSNKGAYYGTFTNSCYFTDGNEFKFLIVYPEAARDTSASEQASFLLGRIMLNANESLLLHKTSSGNKLQIYNKTNDQFSDFEKDVDPRFNSENRDFKKIDKFGYNSAAEPITIPDHDITSKLNDGYYLLSKNSTTNDIELKNFDISNGSASSLASGKLASETILVQETELPGVGGYKYNLWAGNPFTRIGTDKGKIVGNERIALSRGSGEIVYEFVDDNDKQISTSNAICSAIGGCNMKDLNLIPNIRTYLKSTLASADIADMTVTQGVNQTALITNVKNMLANDDTFKQNVGASVGGGATPADVAQALVTSKQVGLLGQAVLDANDSNGNKLEQQLAKDGTFQANVASGLVGSSSFKAEVISDLKRDSTFKKDITGPQGPTGLRGPRGQKGDPGRDAIPADVAQELVTKKSAGLGKAVLDANDSNGHKLEQQLAKDGAFQTNVANKLVGSGNFKTKVINGLKGDKNFKQDVTGPKGEDGAPGRPGKHGHPGAEGPAGIQGSKGDTGSQGPKGENGAPGRPGKHGHPGAEGSQGEKGERGTDGAKGPKGEDGAPGRPGKHGHPGAEGPQGEKGERGAKGPEGPPGLKGEDGAPGRPGKHGHKGAEGSQGEKGERGAKGPEGPPGPKGDDGATGRPGKYGHPGAEGPAGSQGDPGPEGPQGERGTDGRPGKHGHKGAEGPAGIQGSKGEDGAPGRPGKHGHPGAEGPAGSQGEQGERGIRGLQGLHGQRGGDSEMEEMISRMIAELTNPSSNPNAHKFVEQLTKALVEKSAVSNADASAIIQNKVNGWGLAYTLLLHSGLTRKDAALALAREKISPDGLAKYLLEYAKLNNNQEESLELVKVIADNFLSSKAPRIASLLSKNTRFKREVKGEKGDDGDQGPQGEPGPQGDPGPEGPKGDQGPQGDIGPEGNGVVDGEALNRFKRTIDEFQKKPVLKVVPGKSYSESRQEAEIKLETEGREATIATFLKVGYFFKNDELYIHDHITGNSTLMPKGFHFLTVVKTGLNDYKLAFCNNLGNLFFEHKKYNKTYANLPEECKLIDLKYIKGSVKIDLGKYYLHEHAPPFAVKKGDAQGQSFENHIADVYEIERNEKVGALIDEFGFYEHGIFNYINHNKEHTQELDPQNFKYEGGFQLGSESIHPVVLDDSYTGIFNYFRDWVGL